MLAGLQMFLVFAFAALVILGAVWDAASYTIPNWISFSILALFPILAWVLGLGWMPLGLHLAIGSVALIAGMAMFALGWIGGGDAKLFAAAALWLGPIGGPPFLIAVGVAGGILAAVLLLLRSDAARPLVLGAPAWIGRLAEPGAGIPYGVAIAAGALYALPVSGLV